jgi:DnaJ family protein C protein 7
MNVANGSHVDLTPIPPPHKTATKVAAHVVINVEAESFKMAGNKYFKQKEFEKAIQEYTNGMCDRDPEYGEHRLLTCLFV